MSTFEQSRICSLCENEETRFLEKIDAAFVQTNRWGESCGHCGSSEFSSVSLPMPSLDDEILSAWSQNDRLDFSDQDEDLILAASENRLLLQAYVVRDDVKLRKRATMLSALCVLAYDCLCDDDEATYQETVEFLSNNRHLFAEIGDGEIFDYVKKSVYPKIGITFSDKS